MATEFFELEDNVEYQRLEETEPVGIKDMLMFIIDKIENIEESLIDLVDILTDNIE